MCMYALCTADMPARLGLRLQADEGSACYCAADDAGCRIGTGKDVCSDILHSFYPALYTLTYLCCISDTYRLE
jgi:hypothetical protein